MTTDRGVRLAIAACLAASLAWFGAIVAAPAGLEARASSGRRLAAAAVYLTGHTVCHQRPERSFRRGGHPLPVCARCTGMYAAAPVACLIVLCLPAPRLASAWRWMARPATLAIGALPTILTVGIEWATGWTSAAWRAAAGVTLGLAGAGLVCAAIGQRGRRPAPPPLPDDSARL